MNALLTFFRRLTISCPFALCLIVTTVLMAQDTRTWTSSDGKFQKQATWVETQSETVLLRLESGQTIEVPIAKLSDKDQKYLASLSEPKGVDTQSSSILNLRGAKLGGELEKRINEFHRGEPQSEEVLRVVYFHGSDSKPQSNHQKRLDQILTDIQDFYYEEMRQNGFETARKMPLEKIDGELVVHVVAGQKPTRSYSDRSESARGIRDECKFALRKKVDFDSDYVLIVCGLVQKNGQRYIFNSPNYGLPSDHTHGCSFVPDCDKFDLNLIKDTKSKISYAKEGKQFVETFAKYNSKRAGAAAHELGHALNLPHNGQTKADLSRKGNALMGYGNRTYRKQKWDRKSKGSFMTLAMSATLAAHPLFTGSDKERWNAGKCKIESLNYTLNGRKLEIKGEVSSEPPPLAVIAFVDPAEGEAVRDYDATTWVGGVGENGTFHVTVDKHLSGPHEMRLTVLLANGATRTPVSIQYETNRSGVPDVARLNSSQTVGPIEKLLVYGKDKKAAAAASELLEQFENSDSKPSEDVLAQLRHIVSLGQPIEVRELADVTEKTVYLSDVNWTSAKVGFEQPARNRIFVNPRKAAKNKSGVLLQVGGSFHEKGIYGHALSSFVFDLDGKWSEFECVAGLQSGAPGRVKFLVKGDGREIYNSGEVAGSTAGKIRLNIKGVRKLELMAQPTTKVNGGCWTVWASPKLTR